MPRREESDTEGYDPNEKSYLRDLGEYCKSTENVITYNIKVCGIQATGEYLATLSLLLRPNGVGRPREITKYTCLMKTDDRFLVKEEVSKRALEDLDIEV